MVRVSTKEIESVLQDGIDAIESRDKEIKGLERKVDYWRDKAKSQIAELQKEHEYGADQWTRAELLSTEVSNWQETYAQELENTDFYRNIITQIGERFGREARTSDDGSIQEDVLALKVPELVEELHVVLEAARPVAKNVTPKNWCNLQRAIDAVSGSPSPCDHKWKVIDAMVGSVCIPDMTVWQCTKCPAQAKTESQFEGEPDAPGTKTYHLTKPYNADTVDGRESS